ncbi:MAG: tetratricopeptide repeat protein [Deltaproteobacteria bacterium]|nr:tetratricopeptide repeat protein [Deltaproteobacteria bacterium]MBW2359560.1 tetratricopeptide repeat protein [Deltaproteobacteria bacterium]
MIGDRVSDRVGVGGWRIATVGRVHACHERRVGTPPPHVAVVLLLCATWLGGCRHSSQEAVDAQFQVHLHKGHLALQMGEPADAADAYRRALRVRPEAPEPLHGIARCHSARGDGRSALFALARLEARHPAYHRSRAGVDLRFALYQAAKQYLWAGDSARALELCERLAALEPGHAGLAELHADAQLREAARFYVGGRVPEAETLVAEFVGHPLAGSDAAHALAQMLIESDRAGLAISVLSDALRRHPSAAGLKALMERALAIRYPNALSVPGGRPELACSGPPPQRDPARRGAPRRAAVVGAPGIAGLGAARGTAPVAQNRVHGGFA